MLDRYREESGDIRHDCDTFFSSPSKRAVGGGKSFQSTTSLDKPHRKGALLFHRIIVTRIVTSNQPPRQTTKSTRILLSFATLAQLVKDHEQAEKKGKGMKLPHGLTYGQLQTMFNALCERRDTLDSNTQRMEQVKAKLTERYGPEQQKRKQKPKHKKKKKSSRPSAPAYAPRSANEGVPPAEWTFC